MIRDFAASVDLLVVVEELDGFIEDHCRNLGLSPVGKDKFPCIDELSQNQVAERLGLPHSTEMRDRNLCLEEYLGEA